MLLNTDKVKEAQNLTDEYEVMGMCSHEQGKRPPLDSPPHSVSFPLDPLPFAWPLLRPPAGSSLCLQTAGAGPCCPSPAARHIPVWSRQPGRLHGGSLPENRFTPDCPAGLFDRSQGSLWTLPPDKGSRGHGIVPESHHWVHPGPVTSPPASCLFVPA